MIGNCKLCNMFVEVRKHHLIPRCKKGKETIDCWVRFVKSHLHHQWSHNQLRSITYNSVESILQNEGFQKI